MKQIYSGMPLLLGMLWLGGCGSSVPIPTEKLASVETAIVSAKDKEAPTYAALELMKAEKKLAEAKDLIAKEEYEEASRLLDLALSDAQLAEAKADTERTRKIKDELRDSVDTLQKEIDRNQNQ